MEVKEKDGSITALRDQVATLTSVLHERQGEQGHISKLMKENHEVVSLTQQLQHERDQLIMFVEQRKQECENLRSEVSTSLHFEYAYHINTSVVLLLRWISKYFFILTLEKVHQTIIPITHWTTESCVDPEFFTSLKVPLWQT